MQYLYSIPSDDNVSFIVEISFIKAESDQGTAPAELYYYIENDYYEVRESLKNATWRSEERRVGKECRL